MKRTLLSWVVSHVGCAAMIVASGAVGRAEGPVKLPKLNDAGRPTRVIEMEGFRVELDLSGQVIAASAEEEGSTRYGDQPFDRGDTVEVVAETPLLDGPKELLRLKPGRRFLVAEVEPNSLSIQVLLDGRIHRGKIATANVKRIDVPDHRMRKTPVENSEGDFVSTGMLMSKAKQFDDGLYAAVELAAQEGAGDFPGKKRLLAAVQKTLSQTPPTRASATVAGAAQLGGVPAELSPELRAAAEAETTAFLADPMSAKPLGFYTWSDPLSRIFRQDRMLQTPLKPAEGADGIVAALRADEEASRTYAQYLALVSRLTNPWDYPDFRAAAADRTAVLDADKTYRFFPPSSSHEAELIKKLFGNGSIPEGFDLMTELIARIRQGSIDLKPTSRSGWYDHQAYALETLAMPEKAAEAAKIRYDEEYRKLLTDYFKAALALARETHVKQLESPSAGAAAPPPRVRIYLGPEISVEPTATHYRRRADAYRFVHGLLRETFGEAGLKKLRRLTAEGPVEIDVDAELARMTALFDGAALVAARQLGMKDVGAASSGTAAGEPSSAASSEAAAEAYLAWAAGIEHDPDLSRDARMMVPVFYDLERKKMKVWVFLGWKARQVKYGYATRPTTRVLNAQGREVDLNDRNSPELVWISDWHGVSVPVVEEVYVSRLLDRDEFRRHCDAYVNREAILTNLE